MSTNKECCINCKFFDLEFYEQELSISNLEKEIADERITVGCFRYPPVLHKYVPFGKEGGQYPCYDFVQTYPNSWCGEFRPRTPDLLDTVIDPKDWSVRSRKAFRRFGIFTLRDLVNTTSDQLLECRNFSDSSLKEVTTKLQRLGLFLKDQS